MTTKSSKTTNIAIATVFATAAMLWYWESRPAAPADLQEMETVSDARAQKQTPDSITKKFEVADARQKKASAEDIADDVEEALLERSYQAMKARLDEAAANRSLEDALRNEILSAGNPDAVDLQRYGKDRDIIRPLLNAIKTLLDQNVYLSTAMLANMEGTLKILAVDKFYRIDMQNAASGAYARILEQKMSEIDDPTREYLQSQLDEYERDPESLRSLLPPCPELSLLQNLQRTLVSGLRITGKLDISAYPEFKELTEEERDLDTLSARFQLNKRPDYAPLFPDLNY